MSAVEINLDFKKVKPKATNLILGMGYRVNSVPELVKNATIDLIQKSEKYAEIRGGYKIFNQQSVTIEKDKITIENTTFLPDRIITKQLVNSESAAFIAVTLGNKFDSWINQYFKNDDPLLGFIADSIGSEIIENAADAVELLVENESKKNGFNCTNRYSPGYCGWHVSEQHKFFSFLPNNFCGIELSESALMKPVKSLNAIIGIGKECEKKDYHCSLCSMEDCYKRNRRVEFHQ